MITAPRWQYESMLHGGALGRKKIGFMPPKKNKKMKKNKKTRIFFKKYMVGLWEERKLVSCLLVGG